MSKIFRTVAVGSLGLASAANAVAARNSHSTSGHVLSPRQASTPNNATACFADVFGQAAQNPFQLQNQSFIQQLSGQFTGCVNQVGNGVIDNIDGLINQKSAQFAKAAEKTETLGWVGTGFGILGTGLGAVNSAISLKNWYSSRSR